MIKLPTDYTSSIFFEHAGYPEKTSSGYRASCPICMEGTSWGSKKRLFYFPDQNYLFCHNSCGSFTDYNWVKTVTGKSYTDIKSEIEQGGYDTDCMYFDRISLDESFKKIEVPALPKDSINLFDRTQILFYRDNYWVKTAISFIQRRGILKAKYKPNNLFLSLTDYVHKNRLTIPFYGDSGQVEFYQSRALSERQERVAKFLSKIDSDKTIFNLNKIDYNIDYIFIMEGAIDAMFIPNGIAISGVYLTELQKELLQSHCPFLKKVWVFDNPKIDKTGREKMMERAMNSSDLFFTWSDQFAKYKDLNEFCTNENVWDVDPNAIVERSYVGPSSLLKL